MKISDQPTFIIWSAKDMKTEMKAIRKRNYKAFRSWESKCNWEYEGSDDAINYMVYAGRRLKKNEVYIEVDKQPTFWERRDNTDGFLIHKNVTDVVIDGPYLTVFYDGTKQDYKFIKKFERYDKLMRPKRQKRNS